VLPSLQKNDSSLGFVLRQSHSPYHPSSAFVFSPSKSNRSGPMRISRTASAFAAVLDVHRSSDPGERGDEVTSDTVRSRYKRIVYKRIWVASLPFQSVWATLSSY